MKRGLMKKKNSTVIGAFFLVLSALFFALMGMFVRLSGDLPVFQKVFFRNAVAAVVAFVLLAKSKDFRIKKGCGVPLFFRALIGTLAIVGNFYAIDNMNYADATILNKLAPFFAVIASIFLLKEKPTVRDWVIIAVVFCGALCIVKPSFDLKSVFPALVALSGGLGAGVSYALVRVLGNRGERRAVIVFYFSLFSCVSVLPLMLLGLEPMKWWQVLFLLGAGSCASIAQFSVTTAYTYAPAKSISVYDYCQVLFSALIGLIAFGELPDWLSFVGYAIIISAAIVNYIFALKDGKKEQALDPAPLPSCETPDFRETDETPKE